MAAATVIHALTNGSVDILLAVLLILGGVIGAEFLVSEYREGVVVWDRVPESMSGLADAERRIGFAVVDALADLHSVVPDEVGLGDLGRPEGYLERQVSGWRKRCSSVFVSAS